MTTKKKEQKISDILNKAADDHLWSGKQSFSWSVRAKKRKYSCESIIMAEGLWDEAVRDNFSWSSTCKKSKAVQFVKQLGVKVGSTAQFDCFYNRSEQQQARYAWLKFAALYAKEQGL